MNTSALELGTRKSIHCNECHQKTYHTLVAVHPRHGDELIDEGTPAETRIGWYKFEYRLWVCRGCDTAVLEEAFTNDAMYDPDKHQQIWRSKLYPKRAVHDLQAKHFARLSRNLAAIYREVISCYNIDAAVLCAIGLRSLMEGICAEKGVKVRNNLGASIGQMSRYLPQKIVDNLQGFRFMGNDAAHDLQAPGQRDLRLAIEIMEDLLNFLYALEHKTSRLPQK